MNSRFFPIVLTIAALVGLTPLRAQSTVNVGVVSASTNTGYILNANGNLTTNGEVLVGYFSISQAQIAAIINGWTNSLASYSKYSQLAQYFTQVGTGASNYGSVPSGTAWDFNANGQVTGTSSGISTNVLPPGAQLYVWSFSTTNLTSNSITSATQWALATATNWLVPSSGTESLVLSNVASSTNVLIGTSLFGSGGSNNASLEMFTQRYLTWTNRGGDFLWNTASTNWTYLGSPVTYQNGDILTFDSNASGTVTVQTNGLVSGVNPGGMNIALVNSLTLTGAGIGGSGTLSLSGIGTLTLAKSNSFTGGVVLNGGNLTLGDASAMGSGALVVNSNAVLQPSSTMAIANPVTVATNASLTLQTPSSMTLSLQSLISGSGGLTKSGSGTLTLGLAESYTGPTVVNSGSLNLGTGGSLASTNVSLTGGTLLLGASNQLSQTTAVTLNGGTLSMGGAGTTRDPSVQIGTLTLTGTGVLDFSALGGASSITLSSIKGLSSQNLLSIYNYSPGTTRLSDLAGSSDFSPSLLTDIRFYSGGSGSSLLGIGGFSSNDIVPVPEPPVAYALIAILLGAAFLRHSGRRSVRD